jgi:hypothetical protein
MAEKILVYFYGLGLDSYDQLFSNQDTLPKGGFGHLIALPLQRKSRTNGNSVFIDESFTPYPDQWLYLSYHNRNAPYSLGNDTPGTFTSKHMRKRRSIYCSIFTFV